MSEVVVNRGERDTLLLCFCRRSCNLVGTPQRANGGGLRSWDWWLAMAGKSFFDEERADDGRQTLVNVRPREKRKFARWDQQSGMRGPATVPSAEPIASPQLSERRPSRPSPGTVRQCLGQYGSGDMSHGCGSRIF